MKPVQTERSNMVYFSQDQLVGDLHCERVRVGHIRSVWHPSDEERAHLAAGGNLLVEFFVEPIPPMSISTTNEKGYGEDDEHYSQKIAELKRRWEAMTDDERGQGGSTGS